MPSRTVAAERLLGFHQHLDRIHLVFPTRESRSRRLRSEAPRWLDSEAIEQFLAPADLIIAHNARFARPFCERLARGFEHKVWACSHAEIAWGALGFEGPRLGDLLGQCGWFHQSHRAVGDCRALLEALASPLAPVFPSTTCSHRSGGRSSENWAEGSPYDMKDALKAHGYRWNDGGSGN